MFSDRRSLAGGWRDGVAPEHQRDVVSEVARAAITAAQHAYLAHALVDESRLGNAEPLVRAIESAERLQRWFKVERGAAPDPDFHALVSSTLRAAADAMDMLGRPDEDERP